MEFFGKTSLDLKEAILASLAYYDLFSYPLTDNEVWFWLPKKANLNLVKRQLRLLVDQGQVNYQFPFYFLSRSKIIAQRREREFFSKQKLIRAKKIGQKLARFPWVRAVAVSGNLTMKAAGLDDDIDFLIFAQKNCLYRARLISVLATEFWGLRRRPGQVLAPDKICLNLFLENNNLLLPPSRRDFYTAHEALQLLPVAGNNRCYWKFLKNNNWLASFLPQAYRSRFQDGFINDDDLLIDKKSLFEELAKTTQLAYMRHRGNNKLTGRQLFFHPKDQRQKILARFEKKWQKLIS